MSNSNFIGRSGRKKKTKIISMCERGYIKNHVNIHNLGYHSPVPEGRYFRWSLHIKFLASLYLVEISSIEWLWRNQNADWTS